VIDSLIIVRSVHIAATVLAAGTICFAVVVAAPALRAGDGTVAAGIDALRRRWTLMIWIALAAAIVSGAGWLALLAADIYGASIVAVCLHGGVWSVLTDTRFGLVWTARLALALLLGVLMLRPAARIVSIVQLCAGACLLGLLAFVGHAGATPGPAGEVHLASDIVHLAAAGAWLGGLPALAILLSHSRGAGGPAWTPIVVRTTDRFSMLGIFCVAALLLSGLINSWNLLGGPRDLIATDYGRLVLLKIMLFTATVGIAAVNRFDLKPRLAEAGVMRTLERNSLAETGLGVCVILFVGALGTMPPPGHGHEHPAVYSEIPAGAAFVHIHSEQGMADVTISPGRPGNARATIRLWNDDLTPLTAQHVTVTLTGPGAGSKPTTYTAYRAADDKWTIEGIELSQPGNWAVVVDVLIRPSNRIVLDAPIVIEQGQ
jgi:copper resistance protein D